MPQRHILRRTWSRCGCGLSTSVMLRGCPNARKTAAFIDEPRRTQMEEFSPQGPLLLRRAHELAADREPGRIAEAADQPPNAAPGIERDQHRGDAEHDHIARAV